ncbi:hypothetical protein BH09ACT7_BH09ACT7_11820 [soil metagenome]
MNNDSESNNTDAESRKSPPPVGPTDHGGKGGMATREVAPDVAEPDGK